MPFVAPPLVDEPDPARLGLAPCPRPPRHRQADAEQPEHRPSRDHPGDHAAIGPPFEDPDVLVMGEQPRPALHVPCQREHHLRRRRDIDRDGAFHASAPGHTSPIACRATDTSFSWADLVATEPGAAVRGAIDLVGQSSAGHLDAVQDAEEVQVGAARVLRVGVEVREHAFDVGDAARQPAFLAQLADDGVIRMFPEIDATAG